MRGRCRRRPAQIAQGQAVYAKQCVQCHGETGKGDGKDATGNMSDFSKFETFAKIEAGRLDQELASTHIPSFAGTTSELERRAVIDYIRTFAYDYSGTNSTTTASSTPDTPSPASTPARRILRQRGAASRSKVI